MKLSIENTEYTRRVLYGNGIVETNNHTTYIIKPNISVDMFVYRKELN